jgi:hypothetical protein
LDHYIIPLLYCEIGIGDLILSGVREFVSEQIEYISSAEASTREEALEKMDETIKNLQAQRDAYKESTDRKKLASLKAKVGRAGKALTELGAIGEVPGVVKASHKRAEDWNAVFK